MESWTVTYRYRSNIRLFVNLFLNPFTMNRFVLFLLAGFLVPASLSAQDYSICSQVIGASGLDIQVGTQQWSYTVGESVITTLVDQDLGRTITQGFQQPEYCGTTSSTTTALAEWNLVLYPNPTADLVFLHFDPIHSKGLEVMVFDPVGRLVQGPRLINNPDELLFQTASWQAGIYTLRITSKETGDSASLRFIRL